MKATAEIKGIKWDTAIWFDTKSNTYLLPVKAEIRKRGDLKIEEILEVILLI